MYSISENSITNSCISFHNTKDMNELYTCHRQKYFVRFFLIYSVLFTFSPLRDSDLVIHYVLLLNRGSVVLLLNRDSVVLFLDSDSVV